MILLDPEAAPVVGHRGASGELPENTIAAFERAVAQGANALELDVRLSADGVPVVIHDPTLDRTTSGSGLVRAMPYDELRTLDAGQGEPIPAFREVLARFGGVPLIVELKEPEAAPPVVKLLEFFGMTRQVLVGAFDQAALPPVRRAGIATSASRSETTRWWLGSRIGLASRRVAYQAFTVPEFHGRLRVVDRRFVRTARRRALPVHVWTVDDPQDATRLWRLGVNGVISNLPGAIAHVRTPVR